MRQQSGFTLIEVLVAFLILTVAGIGLAALSSSSSIGNRQSRNVAEGVSLASEKIEEIRGLPFSDVQGGADSGTLTSSGESGGIYSRSWSVSDTAIQGIPAKVVTVTVSWTDGGAASLSTQIVEPRTIIPGFFEAFRSVSVESWDEK